MPIVSFSDANTTCTLPPFSEVSNSQFFFRVNTFDIELAPQAPGKPLPGLEIAKLGIPITDLFPKLLPDFGASMAVFGTSKLSIRTQGGVFLPASKPHRFFDSAHVTKVSAADLARRSVKIGSKKVKLSDQGIDALRAGSPIFVAEDRMLVRVELADEPNRSGAVRSRKSATAFHLSESVSIRETSELDDDDFEELCELLFEHIPSKRFPGVLKLSKKDLLKLRQKCNADPRFPEFDRKHKGKHRLDHPRYVIGYLTEFEQTWNLLGYSRGALISSLTLIPDEEVTIEVFTWDRSKLEQEQDRGTEVERSVETSALTRISSQLNNTLTETTDKNANLGLGASLPVEAVKLNADGQVGVTDTLTQGITSTVDTINETTRRAAERFKTTSQIKVVQTRETGTETRVTRNLHNPNRSRALTVHCFEVIEHYGVTTRMVRADRFVLLVDIPSPRCFEIDFVLAHEEKLQRALLGANFMPGFEAAKMLLAQQYFDQRSTLKAELEAAAAKARRDAAAETASDPPIVVIASQVRKKLDALVNLDLISEVVTLADAYRPGGREISHKERTTAEGALGMFNFWLKFKMVTPGMDTRAEDYLAATEDTITPQKAYDALTGLTSGLDDEWLTSLKMIAANVVSVQLGLTLLVPFPWLAPVLLEFALLENNLGLPALLDRAKQAVRAYEAMQAQPPASADASSASSAPIEPPQLYSLQELSTADAEFKKLQLHLEANRTFYLNSLFAQQDPNVRYEILRALGIHDWVENRLLGFVGSRAVFPLKLEALEDETRQFLEKKLLHNLSAGLAKLPTPKTLPISVPTNGMHMEPVLGDCEALEPYLRQRRDIDLAEREAGRRLREALASQAEAEAKRQALRLEQDPPLLDSPNPMAPGTLAVSDAGASIEEPDI
jgi:hypothetical protein